MWLFSLCWLTSLFWVIIRYLYIFTCFIRNIYYWLGQHKWRPHLTDEDMLPVTLSGVSTIFSICLSSFATILIFCFWFFFSLRGMSRLGTTLFLQTGFLFYFFAMQVSLNLSLEAIWNCLCIKSLSAFNFSERQNAVWGLLHVLSKLVQFISLPKKPILIQLFW